MWLWDFEAERLGLRERGPGYWQCVGRYGLPGHGWLSVFPWSEQRLIHARRRARRRLELDTFHVTFLLGVDHVHFYYHEGDEAAWQPAGYTSHGELLRLG